jgi:hypothetical protein
MVLFSIKPFDLHIVLTTHPFSIMSLYHLNTFFAAEMARNIASSMQDAVFEYGHHQIVIYLQHLFDEGVITKHCRVVKRKVLLAATVGEHLTPTQLNTVCFTGFAVEFHYFVKLFFLYFQLLHALDSFHCIESASKNSVVFSKFVYEFPGVEYPFRYKPTVEKRPPKDGECGRGCFSRL